MPPTLPDLTGIEGIKAWLREAVRDYRYQVRWLLLDSGDRLPLPKESALIAKLIEVTITDHVRRKALALAPKLHVDGDESGRMYPDILLSGPALGHELAAVDVKVARLEPVSAAAAKRAGTAAPPRVTSSQITLGPFNSYFRYPQFRFPGALAAYGAIAWHLDVIVVYDLVEGNPENVEPIVVETWRVASRTISSGTRDYIGASRKLDDLRAERGAFATKEEFYEYWRAKDVTRPHKFAARMLAAAAAELDGDGPEGLGEGTGDDLRE
jgi:hypothetical protein